MRWMLVACALGLTACGDDDDGITYEGTPGEVTPADMPALIPVIEARLDDGPPLRFLVDTGAPLTIVNTLTVTDRPEGKSDATIEAFGLTFPDYETAAWAVFDPANELDGIIGGDLLRHFAFSIDYRDQRIWIADPYDPSQHPADLDLEPSIDVPIEVRGGGVSLLPGCGSNCGTIRLAATRVLVPIFVEGATEPVWGLVDSGASAVVLEESFYDSLGAEGRPELTGVTVGTVMGNVDSKMSRVWRVQLGDGEVTATFDDIPIVVMPDPTLFVGIGQEVDRDVRALIGGSMLRRWMTTFDYQEELLRLAPYRSLSHIPEGEYVGVGFRLAHLGDEYVIADVYGGTDADAEGLVELDVVESIAGVPITGASESDVGALFNQYGLGEEVPVGIRVAGGTEEHLVLVEDLLPSYPAPTP